MRITQKEIKATFAEWQCSWLKNPEVFEGYDDNASPEVYGEDAGNYFVEVLKDVRAKSKPVMHRSIRKGK